MWAKGKNKEGKKMKRVKKANVIEQLQYIVYKRLFEKKKITTQGCH